MNSGTCDAFRRKALGIHYTPRWVAELLVSWALDVEEPTILDPSFGGCAFLSAALEHFASRGVQNAANNIFGVDVDKAAWKYGEELIRRGVPSSNLIRGSFLEPTVLAKLKKYGAIVGNPPYVRHHLMPDEMIDKAVNVTRSIGIEIPRTASSWAYFTAVSAWMVAEGGRLALVLPGALLHAEYARPVLAYIRKNFETVSLLHLTDRLFEQTDEESVILLAQSKGKDSGVLHFSSLTTSQIESAIKSSGSRIASLDDFKLNVLPLEVLNAWQTVTQKTRAFPLGHIAKVRIGIVTGANDFFIRKTIDPLFTLRQVQPHPIVTSSSWLAQPIIRKTTLARYAKDGNRTMLAAISPNKPRSKVLASELKRGRKLGLDERYHCRNREPWYSINDLESPQAFLGYMGSSASPIVRNDARALCTNAVHRIWCDKQYTDSIVAFSHSSYFAFECELRGRHYGGGVLKMEPGKAAMLHVSEVTSIVDELDAAPDRESRRIIADKAICIASGVPVAYMDALWEGAKALGRLRQKLTAQSS